MNAIAVASLEQTIAELKLAQILNPDRADELRVEIWRLTDALRREKRR